MDRLELGAFSVSLAVKDLAVSRAFYESLGFSVTGGGDDYCMLRQGTALVGLFQGMFEGNILTFNPGLHIKEDPSDNPLEDWRSEHFTDVRAIQARLKASGVTLMTSVDESQNPDGPGSVVFADPDGNMIMVDQFFPRPGTADRATGDVQPPDC